MWSGCVQNLGFCWTKEGFQPNFADFKHDYTQEFYRANTLCAGCGPGTVSFTMNFILFGFSQINGWICDSFVYMILPFVCHITGTTTAEAQELETSWYVELVLAPVILIKFQSIFTTDKYDWSLYNPLYSACNEPLHSNHTKIVMKIWLESE